MSISGSVLQTAVERYLHEVPDFRGKWRLLRFARFLVDGLPVRSRNGGMRLHLDVADRTNRHALTGRCDRAVRSEVRRLRTGDCFVDVGANCGVYSLLAARHVGATGLVVAFEPSPRSFAKLVRNIELNESATILPFRLALAERSGAAKLDMSANGHSGRAAVTDRHGAQSVPILTVALDGFPALRTMIGDRPTVIKVDVEGFELSALKGLAPLLSRPETRSVVVEIDARNLARFGASPDQVYRLMGDFEFVPTLEADGARHYDQVFARRGAPAATPPPSPAPPRR